MHTLIRQHALAQLDGEQLTTYRAAHAAYYHKALCELELDMNQVSKEKLERVGNDLANVKASWQYYVTMRQLTDLASMNPALFSYFFTSGRFNEGLELFSRSAASLQPSTADATTLKPDEREAFARLQLSEGQLQRNLGDAKGAKTTMLAALTIARETADTLLTAQAITYLGDCHYELGDYVKAVQCFEEASHHFETLGDDKGLTRVNNMLGNLARRQGNYEEAKRRYRVAMRSAKARHDTMGAGVASNNLANIAEAQGNYSEAASAYLECLSIFEELEFLRGIAVVKNNLGLVQLRLGEKNQAEQTLRDSMRMREQLGDSRGMIFSQSNLADVLMAKGDYPQAEAYILDAFQTALNKDLTPVILESYTVLVQLCQHYGATKMLKDLLAAFLQHPNSSAQLKAFAKKEFTNIKAETGNASAEFTALIREVTNHLSQPRSAVAPG